MPVEITIDLVRLNVSNYFSTDKWAESG